MQLSTFSKIFDANFANQIAVANTASSITYQELYNQVYTTKHHLQSSIGSGNNLAIYCSNHDLFIPIFYGSLSANNHVTCIDTQLTGELQEVLRPYTYIFTTKYDLKNLQKYIDTNSKNIICIEELLTSIQNHQVTSIEINEHDIFIYLLTSGSTGTPKPIRKTLYQLHRFSEYLTELLQTEISDVYQCFVPFSHVYGLAAGLALPFYRGAKIRTELPPNIMSILDHSTFTQANVLIATPATFTLLAHRLDEFNNQELSNIKFALTSAARIDPQISEKIIQRGVKLLELFGTTETFGISFRKLYEKEWYHFFSGIKYQQTKDGILCIDSPMTTPEVKNKDGWYYTGDVVKFNNDKTQFSYVGRDGNSIKVDGNKISPIEIEEVLSQHPDIKDVAVKGVISKNVLKGEVIIAYIVSDREIDLAFKQELIAICLKHLAPYKKPYHFEKITKIPRKIGKIRYRELPTLTIEI